MAASATAASVPLMVKVYGAPFPPVIFTVTVLVSSALHTDTKGVSVIGLITSI